MKRYLEKFGRRGDRQLLVQALLSQALGFVSIPVAVHLYGYERLGFAAVFLTLGTLIGSVSNLAMNYHLPTIRGNFRALAILSTSALVSIPLSLLFTYGLLVARVFPDLGRQQTWACAALCFAYAVASAWNRLFRAWLTRNGSLGLLAAQLRHQSLGRLGFLVLLSTAPSVQSILAAETIALIACTYRTFLIPMVRSARRRGLRLDRGSFRHAVRQAGWLLPSTLLDSLSSALPTQLIFLWWGGHVTGIFTVAMRVLNAPQSSIGNSSAESLTVRLKEADAHGRSSFRAVLGRFARRFGVAASAVYAVIAVLGLLLLLTNHREVGLTLAVLSPAYAAMLCISPLSRALYFGNSIRIKLLYDVTVLMLIFGFLRGASHLGFRAVHEVAVALSAALLTSYFVYGCIIWFACGKLDAGRPVIDSNSS